VGGLVFFGWNVVKLAVQAAIVVPVDPLHRGVLHVVDRAQRRRQEWAAAADGFGLEQPDRGLGQCVVVGVADATDGCRDPFQHQPMRQAVQRTRVKMLRFTSAVCSPADAGGNVAKLPPIADVEDFHLVPFPQLLAERRGLRAPVGV
jgi:hypothetical protein